MTTKEQETHRRNTVYRYRESGMTRKAYCEAHDVPLSTLDLWIRRYRNEPTTDGNPAISMVSVGTAASRPAERRVRVIARSGVTVELDLPAAEEEIATVLRAMAAV